MGGEGSGRKPNMLKSFLPVKTGVGEVLGNQPFDLPNLGVVKRPDGTIYGPAFAQVGNVSGAGTVLNDADGNIVLGGTVAGGGGSQWTSGAATLWPIDTSKGVSGASLYTTGAITGGGAGHDQFSDFVADEHLPGSTFATSGGATISLGDHAGDTSIHQEASVFAVSGAFLVSSSVDHDQTTNFVAAEHVTASAFATSGGATVGLGTHISDSTDPHGATLTQTNITSSGKISGATVAGTTLISGASIVTAEDIAEAQSGAAKVVGVITSSGATPLTASGYAEGTIFVQYTP